MKKLVSLFAFAFILVVTSELKAQYSSSNLTAATDTIRLGDGTRTTLSHVFNFNYDSKSEAIFAQVSMDAHHLNPFDAPEIIVNGKNVAANIYMPSLAASTKLYFFKIKNKNDIIVNTSIGNHVAKVSFLLSASDLLPGKNFIRITVGNRTIENVDDFAITNAKIEFRAKAPGDSFSDYSK